MTCFNYSPCGLAGLVACTESSAFIRDFTSNLFVFFDVYHILIHLAMLARIHNTILREAHA